MNKIIIYLVCVILLLIVFIAFLVGRNTKTAQISPSSEQSGTISIAQQARPAVAMPPAQVTLIGTWFADIGNNQFDWYSLKSDGTGLEYHANSTGNSQQMERTFRWSQEGSILHLSDIVVAGVSVDGLPTTLDYGCHMAADGQSFSQGFDPDGTKPTLDSIPDLIYKRK
jgi:hypothetical protein